MYLSLAFSFTVKKILDKCTDALVPQDFENKVLDPSGKSVTGTPSILLVR